MIEPWQIDIYSRNIEFPCTKSDVLKLADSFDETIGVLQERHYIVGAYFGFRNVGLDGKERMSFKVQVKNANRI